MKRFGIALMMVAGLALSSAGCGKDEAKEAPPAAEKTIEDQAQQAVEKTEQAAEQAAEKTEQAVDEAAGEAEEAAGEAKEGAEEAAE